MQFTLGHSLATEEFNWIQSLRTNIDNTNVTCSSSDEFLVSNTAPIAHTIHGTPNLTF